jgi:raffinose/stachyose/melibiose transport system substrate-binding protein
MKKGFLVIVALALALGGNGLFAAGGTDKAASGTAEKVQLVMGSWRADDVAQMQGLLAEYTKTHPNVTIDFKPTNPPDYNATLRLQLTSGTGPDLMYARSYATGIQLYKDGFFADVSATPGL